MHRRTFILPVVIGLLLAALPAAAQLIVTQVSLTSGSVIGGSPSIFSGSFNGSAYAPASNVVDQQTGTVTESADFQHYWLGNSSTGYFVLDLGAAYTITEIDLFNTHNGSYSNSGTNAFHISASNSVSFVSANAGYALDSPTSTLSGWLSYTGSGNPIQDSFTSSNSNLNDSTAYRYLSFSYDSTVASSTEGGLNEIRLYATTIPEPASYAVLFAAGAIAFAAGKRRKRTIESARA